MIISPSVWPISDTRTANTYGVGDEDVIQSTSEPVAAKLASGGFVIVWTSQDQDGEGGGIFGQRFTSNGEAVGTEFQINTYTANTQNAPAVASLPDGGFVVTWTSNTQDGFERGIYAQNFDSNGDRVGSEYQVSSNEPDDQFSSDVISFGNGSLFFAWTSSGTASESVVIGRGFASDGTALSEEFLLHEDGNSTQRSVSLTPMGESSFAATWQRTDQFGTNFIQSSFFSDLVGGTTGAIDLTSATYPVMLGSPLATALSSEEYFVQYQSGDGFPDISGFTVGSDNSLIKADQKFPGTSFESVFYDDFGVQTFLELSYSGTFPSVEAYRYLPTGEGAEVQIQPEFSGGDYDRDPTVAKLDDETAVVAWSANSTGSGDIVFQLVKLNHFPSGTVEVTGSRLVGETLTASAVDIADADGVGEFHFQWFRNEDAIPGATGSDYVLQEADAGLAVYAQISFLDGSGVEERVRSDDSTLTGLSLIGTEANDNLQGSAANDFISGLAGDDTLVGNDGSDTLDGGLGADLLNGGHGDNHVTGGDAETDLGDRIVTFSGDDYIFSGAGDDDVEAGSGDDTLVGGIGRDTLFGHDGDDEIRPGPDMDELAGGFGLLDLSWGADKFVGNAEEILGDTVLDFFLDDVVIIENSTLYGDALWETNGELTRLNADLNGDGSLEFYMFFTGNLVGSPIEVLQNGADVGVGVRNFDGTNLDDNITGNVFDNLIRGFEGRDLLAGAEGNDEVQGGEGNDSLYGGLGNDTLYGEPGNDSVVGGDGDDQLIGGAGNDTLSGEDGADNLNGGTGDDLVLGEGGNDTISGGDGSDTLNGGDGNNVIIGGDTEADLRDIVYAGDGHDNVDAGYGNDLVYGMGGDDTIAGGGGADNLQGQDGNDVITGSSFSDEVFGGAGDDFVNGGYGSDRVNGGTGADKFYHEGDAGHGSDWIQDYAAAQGDVLLFGQSRATPDQFQVNFAHTVGDGGAATGDPAVMEAFVIYKPTGQIMWALVDGEGQDSINIQINGETFDLLV